MNIFILFLGTGFKYICNKLKQSGVKTKGIIHDGDSKAYDIAKTYWRNIANYYDKGHFAKNIRKSVEKSATKFPSLKDLGGKVLKAFKLSLRNCDEDPEKFKELMMQQYKHFCNMDHSHCSHVRNYKPQKGWITNKETQVELKKKFTAAIEASDHIVHNLSSNLCESFAHEKLSFVNKKLNQRLVFKLGTYLTVISYTLGNLKNYDSKLYIIIWD